MLELLNQLDGFEPTKNIKVIMATNRLDILDPALLRPGRIDRKIEFPPPSVEARADILRIHSRKMNLTRGINLTKIAEKMNGCSGAELKGVCTEAGMYALRERRVHVTQEDFELATAKVLNKHDDKEGMYFGGCLCSCPVAGPSSAALSLTARLASVARKTVEVAVARTCEPASWLLFLLVWVDYTERGWGGGGAGAPVPSYVASGVALPPACKMYLYQENMREQH